MEEAGEQERSTIGKGAAEKRATNEQTQRFAEKDETKRIYNQAQKAYRF